MATRNGLAITCAAAMAAALAATGGNTLLAGEITFGGRTWKTNDPDLANPPTYGVVADAGVMTGTYGPEATIATPLTVGVGDTVSYDYTLTNPPSNNWVGDAWGDFRGGTMEGTPNFVGYLITGRAGYKFDFGDGSARTARFQDAGFNLAGPTSNAGTEKSPGINVTWAFPTANSYQVTVRNVGSTTPLLNFAGSTGGNPISAIAYFRQELNDSLQTVTIKNFAKSSPGSLVFGFEGGATAQGFKNLQAPGGVTSWASTNATIDIGGGFNLLSASQGSDRVVVTPYADRDNFGHAQHKTLVLRSPTFSLDGSGGLAVDMFGGRKYGENTNPADLGQADPAHVGELGSLQRNASFDFAGAGEVNDGKHIQGFALRDALTGQYVLLGSNAANNDGDQTAGTPYDAGVWHQAGFTKEQLAPFANNGRKYQVDFVDSFGETSWGHIGFDNLRVPGVLAPLVNGDTDGDGFVTNTDTLAAIGNFTGPRAAGPVAKPDGKARIHGDLDDDGDVTNTDLLTVIGNFTGPGAAALADSAGLIQLAETGEATLTYDAADGSLVINAALAPGAQITGFVLKSSSGQFITGVVDFPGPGTTTDLTTEISWANPFGPFTGIRDLDSILPGGLTQAQFMSALSSATYTGQIGTGVRNLDLVFVPEPGALALLAFGSLALTARRRRRML